MTKEGDNIESVNTTLTKGDVALPMANNNSDNLLALTGETRESKTKTYAAEETIKVSFNIFMQSKNLTIGTKKR